ncbi:MAG: hypothetical protein KDB00_18295 [Planctomycetales bacterium]|nr:hypothetical protein [Planctomycetales bacterium]
MKAIQPLCSSDGILLDDFTERSFGWDPVMSPHETNWIGIFHYPPNWPGWLHPIAAAEKLLEAPLMQASLPALRAAITLSKYHAQWLAQRLDVPVFCLLHPAFPADQHFHPDRYLAQSTRKVVQIGWTLRNSLAIQQVELPDGYEKIHLRPDLSPAHAAERRLAKYWNNRRSQHGSVTVMSRLNDQDYDSLLQESVVFLELFDVSACNTVLECIARATPILVNRLPALEEYLGTDYPLFYDSLATASRNLDEKAILQAHEYLAVKDLTPLSVDTFLANLADIVRQVGKP